MSIFNQKTVRELIDLKDIKINGQYCEIRYSLISDDEEQIWIYDLSLLMKHIIKSFYEGYFKGIAMPNSFINYYINNLFSKDSNFLYHYLNGLREDEDTIQDIPKVMLNQINDKSLYNISRLLYVYSAEKFLSIHPISKRKVSSHQKSENHASFKYLLLETQIVSGKEDLDYDTILQKIIQDIVEYKEELKEEYLAKYKKLHVYNPEQIPFIVNMQHQKHELYVTANFYYPKPPNTAKTYVRLEPFHRFTKEKDMRKYSLIINKAFLLILKNKISLLLQSLTNPTIYKTLIDRITTIYDFCEIYQSRDELLLPIFKDIKNLLIENKYKDVIIINKDNKSIKIYRNGVEVNSYMFPNDERSLNKYYALLFLAEKYNDKKYYRFRDIKEYCERYGYAFIQDSFQKAFQNRQKSLFKDVIEQRNTNEYRFSLPPLII